MSGEMTPRRGLEPPRPCERRHLKTVRLPIPPSGHRSRSVVKVRLRVGARRKRYRQVVVNKIRTSLERTCHFFLRLGTCAAQEQSLIADNRVDRVHVNESAPTDLRCCQLAFADHAVDGGPSQAEKFACLDDRDEFPAGD